MILPGQKAPNFTLYDTGKKEHNLTEYRGKKVVLLFFPLAFTSTCTRELCDVRDNISIYDNLNAEIIAISVDSLYTLGKYKDEQNLNFTLLSDWNKQASRAYYSLYEEFGYGMKGVSKRSAFIIDGEGIVRYAEVLNNAGEIPDFNKIKETLSSLS